MNKKKEEILTVIVKEPGKLPKAVKVRNKLEDLQKLVGGYIETVSLFDFLVVLCDEEGRLRRKPYNCRCTASTLSGQLY